MYRRSLTRTRALGRLGGFRHSSGRRIQAVQQRCTTGTGGRITSARGAWNRIYGIAGAATVIVAILALGGMPLIRRALLKLPHPVFRRPGTWQRFPREPAADAQRLQVLVA
jgi:hypothetical protein